MVKVNEAQYFSVFADEETDHYYYIINVDIKMKRTTNQQNHRANRMFDE